MPGAASNGFDAQRFAALWAGCDTGNGNEAEAVTKFRAVWRMAASHRLRIVDCMTGHEKVMAALDAQMKPLRKSAGVNPAELNAARERADKLGAENLGLMRKVRELAETLKWNEITIAKQDETISSLERTVSLKDETIQTLQGLPRKTARQHPAYASAPSPAAAPPRASAADATEKALSAGGCTFGVFYLLAVLAALGWMAVTLIQGAHHWLH
ncbi:MAG: hypothetical protein ACRD3O_00030 [Terriglobia bacterium]